MNNDIDLANYIGKPALLELTAEECVELAHACLKLARVIRQENPTPVTSDEAIGEKYCPKNPKWAKLVRSLM